ncbi:MAG: hypothetical protein J1D88_02875 [Treponema sp.]|nr:hypothetical protein [Treponema sp.]
MPRICLACILTLCAAFVVYARGKSNAMERSVGAASSWQEEFDIQDKPDGKYSALVTATDKAGNQSVVGPFNIRIKDESGLPVVNITNPVQNMRVSGSLNIMGTCSSNAIDSVNLVIDGNEADIKTATGRSFWSFYVDTTSMSEGSHTIEAYGTDINGLRSPVVSVAWHLDRRAPVTRITNIGMGEVVSGKIVLNGTVTDGNGVASVEYSLDGGQTFAPVETRKRFSELTSRDEPSSCWTFTLPIDTLKFPDGPFVCWFRATDTTGSQGMYSFLSVIDNTKPDVKIVAPLPNQAVNGIFTVAGYAKDTVGIRSLSYKWGNQAGDFILAPGNPYWVQELNAIGMAKAPDFVVTATDIAGNQTTTKCPIILDQEADKPVVAVVSPADGAVFESTGENLFFRGVAYDDDGVVAITWQLDDGIEQQIACNGVFYADIPTALSSGRHTISVYGTDKYGVRGNKTTVAFTVQGEGPAFSSAVLRENGSAKPFVNGMELNPESNAVYEVVVNSGSGLSEVGYELTWGIGGKEQKPVKIKTREKASTVTIPVSHLPWGVSRLCIRAVDVLGHEAVHYAVLNVRDLSKVYTQKPGVYFDDSTVASDGGISINSPYSVSGYFVGGTAQRVELVPPTKAAIPKLIGNSIVLEPGTGGSGPVVVRVTTTTGAVYDSRQLYFKIESDAPALTIDNDSAETGIPFEFKTSTALSISGTVRSSSEATVSYRIFSAAAVLNNGIVTSSSERPVSDVHDIKTVAANQTDSFQINFTSDDFVEGISVVEILARNTSGKTTAEAVAVRKIPYTRTELLAGESAVPVPAKPAIYWFEGIDLYACCLYQEESDILFKRIRTELLQGGTNEITFSVLPLRGTDGRITTTHTVTKEGDITAFVSSVDGSPYKSGMPVYIDSGNNENHKATLFIESKTSVASVKWFLEETDTSDGKDKKNGTASLRKITTPGAGIFQYEADIPLVNLPAGILKLGATIQDSKNLVTTVRGTISVLRNAAHADSEEGVYWMPLDGVHEDIAQNRYVLKNGASLTGFANVSGAITASLQQPADGLFVSVKDHMITVNASENGTYRDVVLVVQDAHGGTYKSKAVDIVVHSAPPLITLLQPINMSWVQNEIALHGTTSGRNIAAVEYTLAGENSSEWIRLPVQDGVFLGSIDVSAMPDGPIPIDIRTVGADSAGLFHAIVCKDTEAPKVSVILPEAGAVVNGETTIVFSVQDAGRLQTITYASSDGQQKSSFDHFAPELYSDEGQEHSLHSMASALPSMRVGSQVYPIGNDMRFLFVDAAGNTTTLDSYDFTVDAERDLPLIEIVMPEENAIMTNDFVVSGFVSDDDGKCNFLYRIDNGEWLTVSDEDGTPVSGYHFEIPVQLESMTDNEHVVYVCAQDVHGTKGPEATRRFRISLEEPKMTVDFPAISETVKGYVTMHGSASDKNGISRVQVSIDNGASYNDVEGTSEWTYTFDTHVIQDGTHAVFFKVRDSYGIESLHSTLLSVDNTKPVMQLELPLDDSRTSRNVFFSGLAADNIELAKLYITVRSLDENRTIPLDLAHVNLEPFKIISHVLDISALPDGFYNVQLTAEDAAENVTRVSRNIQLDKATPPSSVSVLYPLNGAHVQGVFNIYGTAQSEEDEISDVALLIDGIELASLSASEIISSDYFKFQLMNVMQRSQKQIAAHNETETVVSGQNFELSEGTHHYRVVATTQSGKKITSDEHTFVYSAYGPWVTVENFMYGDFAMNRPVIHGDAGYMLSADDLDALNSKKTPRAVREHLASKTIKYVQLSLDNGRTYTPVSKFKKGKWQYQIESDEMKPGYHFLLLKAEMMNGEVALERMLVQVDRTPPVVRLIAPSVGGHYSQLLEFTGLASDNEELQDVTLTLSKGNNKPSYEMPGFVHGMYLDASVWGATLWDVGLGLTAFNNAVKIQGHFGQFTQVQRDFVSDMLSRERSNFRFGGNVVGAKIITQFAQIPFHRLFGRDFDWLSATFAVGANFSYFSETAARDAEGNSIPQVLSALLLQVEFPRITFDRMKVFRTWAFYVEPQMWFVSSDFGSALGDRFVPTFSLGLHVNVF